MSEPNFPECVCGGAIATLRQMSEGDYPPEYFCLCLAPLPVSAACKNVDALGQRCMRKAGHRGKHRRSRPESAPTPEDR